jgi:hypothetical protein
MVISEMQDGRADVLDARRNPRPNPPDTNRGLAMDASQTKWWIQDGDGDHRHGTVNGYTNLHCRCEACRKAWAASCYARQQRRRLTDPEDPRHGTQNGYGNYKCRCEPCTAAYSAACLARLHKRKQRQAAA